MLVLKGLFGGSFEITSKENYFEAKRKETSKDSDAALLLTVGSLLLTVELSLALVWQMCCREILVVFNFFFGGF